MDKFLKVSAETIIAGMAMHYPALSVAQPAVSALVDEAINSKPLQKILSKLIERNADLENPKMALIQNKNCIENELKEYEKEVLLYLNKTTEAINIKAYDRSLNEIINDIVTANRIEIQSFDHAKVCIKGSKLEADEINVISRGSSHIRAEDSVVGKNGGAKMLCPKGWEVNQPGGWYQRYDKDGNFSIGMIGKAEGDFTIGVGSGAKDPFRIILERK